MLTKNRIYYNKFNRSFNATEKYKELFKKN